MRACLSVASFPRLSLCCDDVRFLHACVVVVVFGRFVAASMGSVHSQLVPFFFHLLNKADL